MTSRGGAVVRRRSPFSVSSQPSRSREDLRVRGQARWRPGRGDPPRPAHCHPGSGFRDGAPVQLCNLHRHLTAPPLSPSGAVSARHKGQRHCPALERVASDRIQCPSRPRAGTSCRDGEAPGHARGGWTTDQTRRALDRSNGSDTTVRPDPRRLRCARPASATSSRWRNPVRLPDRRHSFRARAPHRRWPPSARPVLPAMPPASPRRYRR